MAPSDSIHGSIADMTDNTIKPTAPSTTTATKKPALLVVRTSIKAGPQFSRT